MYIELYFYLDSLAVQIIVMMSLRLQGGRITNCRTVEMTPHTQCYYNNNNIAEMAGFF